jgi:plasmid stabilization system protein ParE
VAQLEVALKALDDFDRFVAHLERHSVSDPPARIAEIIGALQILVRNPMIGRPVAGGKRELLIGAGSHGYVALYRFVKKRDAVLVLAIRSQSEEGYKRGR